MLLSKLNYLFVYIRVFPALWNFFGSNSKTIHAAPEEIPLPACNEIIFLTSFVNWGFISSTRKDISVYPMFPTGQFWARKQNKQQLKKKKTQQQQSNLDLFIYSTQGSFAAKDRTMLISARLVNKSRDKLRLLKDICRKKFTTIRVIKKKCLIV